MKKQIKDLKKSEIIEILVRYVKAYKKLERRYLNEK